MKQEKTHSRNRATFFIFKLGTIVVISIALIELSMRTWLAASPKMTTMEFRATRPSAYAKSNYWSSSFIEEQKQIRSLMPIGDDSHNELKDFHGIWYTQLKGWRFTAFQPQEFLHTIYLFGNSTLYGSEVPDEYTIPSLLQLLLNKVQRSEYRVVNMGENSATVSRQLDLLKQVKLQAGDIIVFYDGIVEVNSAYYQIENWKFKQRSSTLLCTPRLTRHLLTLKLVCDALEQPSIEANQAFVDQAIILYQKALMEAYRFTQEKKVIFYHFIQPHIWSRPLSISERDMLKTPGLIPERLEDLMQYMWPLLQQFSQAVPTVDLTHELDSERASGLECYLDAVHITELGNAIIAQAIFDVISTF